MPAKTVPETPAVDANAGLLSALLAVQSEAPTLPKDATNPHFRSKYTPLDTIVEKIGPILSKHGLVWMAFPVRDDMGEPALRYELVHAESGETRSGIMPLLLTKSDPQGMGSAITYARRYSLCAVLNLVADDDDDGARAAKQHERDQAGPKPSSEAQRNTINGLCRQKSPTADQLNAALRAAGADVTLDDPHWTQKLTGGRDGTASKIIEWLKDLPAQSDVPSVDPPAHPDPGPDDDVPFGGQETLS